MPAPRQVRVVLVDDQAVAVEALRGLLKEHQDRVVVVDVRVVGEPSVDVILVEPEGQPDATRTALRELVGDSGAPTAAYPLLGQPLVEAIEAIHAGGTDTLVARERVSDQLELTPREAEILSLITRGLTNAEIAAALYLSINSVKTYIRSGYRKIGVSRRTQAVAWGMAHGMAAGPQAAPA